MRAVLTVEVPDEFLERRARELAERHGHDGVRDDAAGYFLGRCQDVADDELPLAFWGWPIEVTVELAP